MGGKLITNLKPLDIQTVYAEMLNRGLSARTVRYAHSVLNMALTQAIKWQMLGSSPAQAVDLPKQQRKEMNAMDREEAGRFLEAAKTDSHHVLLVLLLTTGLRPSEALALKWSDLDLHVGKLSVNRTVARRKGGGWYFKTTKTPNSRRSIDILDTLTTLLLNHREVAYPSEYGLVFSNLNGEPLDLDHFSQRNYKRVLDVAGLPKKFRLYDLRHTCATLLLLAGVNPKVVSERLGHSSIRETMDTYSHVLPSM